MKRKIWKILLFFFLAVFIGLGLYFYGYSTHKNSKEYLDLLVKNKVLENENRNLKQVTPTIRIEPTLSEETLIQRINNLIRLDTNEIPVVMTVSNLSKLENQPFFSSAIIGDKVLMYKKIKKVIIYRPSTDQIIEIGPLLQNEL